MEWSYFRSFVHLLIEIVLHRTSGFVTCAAVFLLATQVLPTHAYEVSFSVTESAGVERTSEPISGGIPLPKGKFEKSQEFAVFSEDGKPIPAQVRPLVVETDGTLRWILVDFQDDIGAGETNHYVLRDRASDAGPNTPLRVSKSEEAIRGDTGTMSFTIDRNAPFGIFDQVKAGGNTVVSGGSMFYEQLQLKKNGSGGEPFTTKKLVAGPPSEVRVWYKGPMRATIEVTGDYRNDALKAGYKVWITVWAGKSRVWVKSKLTNSNPDMYTRIPIKRKAIRLELSGANGGSTVLGAGTPITIEPGKEAYLHRGLKYRDHYQPVKKHSKAGSGETVKWTGSGREDAIEGWIAAEGDQPVFVADKYMAMTYPRRLSRNGSTLVLEGISDRFEPRQDQKWPDEGKRVGDYGDARMKHRWLFDSSHHRSEYLIDFSPAGKKREYRDLAKMCRNRLWIHASPSHYREAKAGAMGRFGTLNDEKKVYEKWGWSYKKEQLPRKKAKPRAYVHWEDNHGESETDSVQALLLMYMRTGERGWFDLGQAWARYHADLQAWRTDGWKWKDGAIWFSQGGPQGNRRVRKEKWNMNLSSLPEAHRKKISKSIRRRSQAKACRCHFYGSGLASYYYLTGDRDAFDAVIDNVEVKDDEMRHFREAKPGETSPSSTRAYGRGFEVVMRAMMMDPGNTFIKDLADLYADVTWNAPKLDERGFIYTRNRAPFSFVKSEGWQEVIKKKNLKLETDESWRGKQIVKVTDMDTGKSWKPKYMGGTWQHVYIQNGADMYARYFNDDNMRDYTIGFARFSNRFMLSEHCNQTWYKVAFDVVDYGNVHDPWKVNHSKYEDGQGHEHSGWYTRFYPDAVSKGYTWTGHVPLLKKGKAFWHYGSKRSYRSKNLFAGPNEVGRFATHKPPKQDSVLETARFFYHRAHPRDDRKGPEMITDLTVNVEGNKATVSFTAPEDRGGGSPARYQVKCSSLPILPYSSWDYAKHRGEKRNWWYAENVEGEPEPKPAGEKETFTVSGVPTDAKYFTVRSADGSSNLSPVSNVAEVK